MYYSFKKYYAATITKLVFAVQSVIVVIIGFMKFAKILIVTLINFNFEVNSENRQFCRYYIGIHRFLYEIIDIFVNLCLENKKKCTLPLHKCVRNEEGISIKSSLKKYIESGQIRTLEPMSRSMKIRENKKFRFPFYNVLIVADGVQQEKATVHSTAVTYLNLKAPTSLYCGNCEPRHFHLNLDE